ncbi:MAG: PaaI family thioesterase [Syntrophobacteraceae bacterium]
MSPDVKFKQLPNREIDMCFGCSRINPHGLQMQFFTDGKSIFSELFLADHFSGWRDVVHGGVIATIFDEVMGRVIIHILKRVALTKSITVNFMKTVYIGRKLRAEARVFELISEREGVLEAFLTDDEGNVCATAKGTFALYDPQLALKRGMLDEDTLADLGAIFNA